LTDFEILRDMPRSGRQGESDGAFWRAGRRADGAEEKAPAQQRRRRPDPSFSFAGTKRYFIDQDARAWPHPDRKPRSRRADGQWALYFVRCNHIMMRCGALPRTPASGVSSP